MDRRVSEVKRSGTLSQPPKLRKSPVSPKGDTRGKPSAPKKGRLIPGLAVGAFLLFLLVVLLVIL